MACAPLGKATSRSKRHIVCADSPGFAVGISGFHKPTTIFGHFQRRFVHPLPRNRDPDAVCAHFRNFRPKVENFRGFSVILHHVPSFPLSFVKFTILPIFRNPLVSPRLSQKVHNFRILAGGCTLEIPGFHTLHGNLALAPSSTPISGIFRGFSPNSGGFLGFSTECSGDPVRTPARVRVRVRATPPRVKPRVGTPSRGSFSDFTR